MHANKARSKYLAEIFKEYSRFSQLKDIIKKKIKLNVADEDNSLTKPEKPKHNLNKIKLEMVCACVVLIFNFKND